MNNIKSTATLILLYLPEISNSVVEY